MMYFAYGSNLYEPQLRARCPGATKVGIARLANYRLAFPRSSLIRMCGVASIEPAIGHDVWGVVFELGKSDLKRLHASEGFETGRPERENRYNWRQISVILNGADVEVGTYIAVRQKNPLLPNRAYVGLIQEGAMEHRLPRDYLGILDTIVTSD